MSGGGGGLGGPSGKRGRAGGRAADLLGGYAPVSIPTRRLVLYRRPIFSANSSRCSVTPIYK